jgi:hypothetical protein
MALQLAPAAACTHCCYVLPASLPWGLLQPPALLLPLLLLQCLSRSGGSPTPRPIPSAASNSSTAAVVTTLALLLVRSQAGSTLLL